MAETVAEAPKYDTEYPDSAPPPAPTSAPSPPVVAGGAPDVAAQLASAQGSQLDVLRRRASAMQPEYAKARSAIEDRRAFVDQNPPPKPAEIPPAPSRKFTDFLAAREGESPLTTIAKMIEGTSLMFGTRGRGALVALTGALQGWKEGDTARADRAFKDWEAESDRLIENAAQKRRAYTDILTAKGLSIDQAMMLARLKALEFGDEEAVAKFQTGNASEWLQYLTQRSDKEREFEIKDKDLSARRAAAEAAAAETRRHHREVEDFNRARLTAKADEDKRQRDEIEAAYTPEVIRPIAIDYATTGKLPPNIARGKSGQFLIPKITADAITWAKEQGLDPNGFPQLRADIASARTAATKLRGVNVVQNESITRMEGHFAKLLELSDTVDRSGRPVLARYQLKTKKEYEGDADTAAYETAAFESAMELSKMVVGSAQGDASTRDEARKMIDGALNKDQLKAVLATLEANAKRNLDINKRSEQDALDVIGKAMGQQKGGKVRIRRRSDGKEFEGDGAVPPGYELVK